MSHIPDVTVRTTHAHLNVEHGREFVHQIHHVTLFTFIFDIGSAQIELSKTVVQVFSFFLYTDNGMNKDRVYGCLCVDGSFSRFVNQLLSEFARKKTAN
jgi:hypothetical protein